MFGIKKPEKNAKDLGFVKVTEYLHVVDPLLNKRRTLAEEASGGSPIDEV